MPGPPFLHGDAVDLHTIEPEDAPFLQATLDDPAVRRHLTRYQPLTEADEREWIDQFAGLDGEGTHLLIVADGDPAGVVGLTPLDGQSITAEIGLFMAKPFWGQGYGTAASRLATDYAFDERRYHRLVAKVYGTNEASKRIWEKLGYRHEAVHQEAGFLAGKFVDMHRYAVLADEWRE